MRFSDRKEAHKDLPRPDHVFLVAQLDPIKLNLFPVRF